VLAVAEERALDGCPDEELLELASSQQRIMVTFDAADFPRICHQWLETGRSHHGCAVLVGIRHHEFGAIMRALDAVFEARPDLREWHDRLAFVSRVG
jgi:hypothetical protein